MDETTYKVILIDDEPELLDLSKQFLELDPGISTNSASSAEEALELIGTNEYDVVVSDYQMPGKDGIQLLKELRAKGKEIPFILFTGKGREEVAIEALNSGADFYLQKGGDPRAQFAELRNMITKSVEKHWMELKNIENEEKFKNIFNSTNDSIHILDLEGRFLEINDIGCAWLGYTKQEMLQKRAKDIDSEQYASQVQDRIKEVMEKGFALFETEWVTKSGKHILVEVSTRRITYLNRPSLLGVARDVSERQRNEKNLIENELKFRTVADFTYDWEYWISPDGQIIYCSPSCERISGYSNKELENEPELLLAMVYQDDRILFEKHIESEKNGRIHEFEFRIVTQDGEIRWIQHTCLAVNDDLGRYLGRRVSNQDITERKKSEVALEANKTLLRETEKIGRIGGWTFDAETLTQTWTAETFRILEIDLGEGEPKVPEGMNFIAPAFRPMAEKALQRAIQFGEPYDQEWEIITAKGNKRWVRAVATAHRDQNKIKRISGSFQDITERKQAEETLREGEKKYHLLVESAAEAIVIEQDGMIRFVNPKAIDIIGLPEKDLISKPFASFVHPDDLAMVVESYLKRLRGEVDAGYYTFRLVVKDEKIKWMDISTVEMDWEGRPATLNFLTDITERKRAEDVLSSQKEFSDRLIDAQQDTVFLFDPVTGKPIKWNNSFVEVSGYNDDEIASMKAPNDFYDEEDLKRANEAIVNQFALGRVKIELSLITKQGVRIPFEYALTTIESADGKSLFLSIGRNVTDRKKADDKIVESEQRYRQLMETANDAILIHEISLEGPGRLIEVNESACQMLGYRNDELLRMAISDLDVPEQEANIPAIMNELNSVKSAFFKTELLANGGRRIPVEISANLIDSKGQKVVLAIIRDITERKGMEDTLKQMTRDWELLFDSTNDAIWLLDKNQRVMRSNKMADLLWPLPNGGAIGLHCWEVVHHTTEPFRGCPVQRAQTSMHREIMEMQFGDRWYQVIADPIIDATGQYIGAVHIVKNITDCKLADEALLESEKRYRLLVDGVSEAIVVIQDGMLRLVNPMAVTITGFSEQELMSTPFASFVHPEDRTKVVENYQRRLKGEDVPIRYTFRLQIKDERTRWVEVSVILIEWEGRPATLNILMDITERKRTEDALQEANRKLNLLSSITRHDIKNQLMATEGSLTLLKMKQPDIASNDDLLRAEVAVKRISSMINFTKEYEDIGVKAPIWQNARKLIERSSINFKLDHVNLVNNIPKGLEVFADPLIAKVLHNLIDNAVRHGGKATTIQFFIEEHEGVHTIICEDDGVGMPADIKEKLFTRGSGKGNGFGLFLSSEILAITGLTILENGEPGKGARFEITVPAGAWRSR